jgi:hypothetical protein
MHVEAGQYNPQQKTRNIITEVFRATLEVATVNAGHRIIISTNEWKQWRRAFLY